MFLGFAVLDWGSGFCAPKQDQPPFGGIHIRTRLWNQPFVQTEIETLKTNLWPKISGS